MVSGTEKKKVSFSALSLVQLPLGVLLKVKLGATKRMKFFSSFCCIILLQQGCNNPVPGLLQPCTMVVTVSITRLNTRLLQPCFMVVTTLNYNLVTTLLHPCNKVVISVWDALFYHRTTQIARPCLSHKQLSLNTSLPR